MPPKKRAANDAAAKRNVKRPRVAPKPQLRPTARLRPTFPAPAPAPPSGHSIISISSTSPDGSDYSEKRPSYPDADNTPSGGILPTDSLQDMVINSIETRPPTRTALTGHAQYVHLTTHFAQHHKTITPTFTLYRLTPPSSIPPGQPLNSPPPQHIPLGPPLPGINYTRYPPLSTPYTHPIYLARTYNPLLPLAILHLARKNLPGIDFSSAMAHLPNVGPFTLPPRFPPLTPQGTMPFLDDATDWQVEPGDQAISIAFLPSFYADARHALGFYTRKTVSRRLCEVVFTPCAVEEVVALGLLGVREGMGRLEDYEGVTVGREGEVGWETFEVGVGGGRWVYAEEGTGMGVWEGVRGIVEREWGIRVRVTERRILEWGREAGGRDGGMWGDARVD